MKKLMILAIVLLSQSMLAHSRSAPTAGIDPTLLKKVHNSNNNSLSNQDSKGNEKPDTSEAANVQKESETK